MANSQFNLADLNGINGFAIDGIDSLDRTGYSVSAAGDINGDGIGDVLVGAPGANAKGNFAAGKTYVVFGGVNNSSINLASLNGSNGFVINGIAPGDYSGFSVSAVGDINNDGKSDLLIGAPFADANNISGTGQSYLVYGDTSIGSGGSFDLSSLSGSNGFAINGIAFYDLSGASVSDAGDVNGDGIEDIVIGAPNASPSGISNAGQSYVLFGSTNVVGSGSFDLSSLSGANGFVINGIAAFEQSGYSVSGAGDVNGDGIDDLIIGAINADPNGILDAGTSYVVFGGVNVGSSGSFELSSLNGSNGFAIPGIASGDKLGRGVSSAGDVNGDGIDDLIVGAPFANVGSSYDAGTSYVIFGGANLGSSGSLNLSSLSGANGFAINGISNRDYSGTSVSSAGDVNGDGIDDLIIGAYYASPNGISSAGQSYIVFGGTDVGNTGTINLSSLDGFAINGINFFDYSGFSVSEAGDINGDGIGDVIIGAFNAEANSNPFAGQAYVVYGIQPLRNSGFETGDFTGWETLGDAKVKTSDLGILPTEGNSQALITNGLKTTATATDIETFLNLTPGTLDTLNNGNTTQGSAIKQTFTAFAGDTLTFDWNFLTNEDTQSINNNDFVFYTLSLQPTSVELADTTSSGFSTSQALGYLEETGYRSVSISLQQSGVYTLGLGVVDVGDNIVNSALLVDDFQII